MVNKKIEYSNYQYGSTVRKEVLPHQYPQPTVEPLRRPKVKTKQKTNSMFAGVLTFCGLFVFVNALSFVHTSSVLSSKQSKLQSITNELRKTDSDISQLETIIASKINLEYIQEVARTKLGMSEPLAHQIVYLSLPKESHTVYPEQ